MYCVSLAVLDQTKRLFGIMLSKNLIFLFKTIFFKQKKIKYMDSVFVFNH